MKAFIKKAIGFVLFFFLMNLLLFVANRYFGQFKIGKENTILLVGNSHSECAVNDDLIDGLANYSNSGESFFYTYFKTKKLLEQNPQIEQLIIEFPNTHVIQNMDEWIWADRHLSHRFPKYGSLMDKEAVKLLTDNNSQSVEKSLPLLLKNNIGMLFHGFDYTKIIGGYNRLDHEVEDSILNQAKQEPVIDSALVSQKNLDYLKKTIELAQSRDISVFLMRSPMHHKYHGYQSEQLFQNIREDQFGDVEFLDFAHYPFPDDHFADLEHLNYKGADKFSTWLNEMLANNLLSTRNKEALIQQEIQDKMEE